MAAAPTAPLAAAGRPRPRLPDWALPWASVAGVLVLFELLPRIGVLPRDHFPPASETLSELGSQVAMATAARTRAKRVRSRVIPIGAVGIRVA